MEVLRVLALGSVKEEGDDPARGTKTEHKVISSLMVKRVFRKYREKMCCELNINKNTKLLEVRSSVHFFQLSLCLSPIKRFLSCMHGILLSSTNSTQAVSLTSHLPRVRSFQEPIIHTKLNRLL